MSLSAPTREAPVTDPARRVLRYVLLSGFFLVLQVALTDFGTDDAGSRVLWLVVGVALLWLVQRRRSGIARAVIVGTSLLGALLWGVSLLDGNLMALAWLGQALPLMTPTVRDHVRGWT